MPGAMPRPTGDAGGVVIFLPRRRRRAPWRELWVALLAAWVVAALLYGLARPFDAHGQVADEPPPSLGAE
jgi:hypothetical protein